MRNKIFILLLVIMLIPFVNSEIICNPSSVSANYEKETSTSTTIQCTNSGVNTSTVSISKTGSYFSIDQSIIGQAPSSKTINITFDQNAPIGTQSGTIAFSDNSASIPITFTVTEKKAISFISFPTSKRITGPQGEAYDRKVTLIIPSNYPNSVTIKSISVNCASSCLTSVGTVGVICFPKITAESK